MTSAELFVDALGRIRGLVHAAVDGLSPEQLVYRPDSEANSIAWLVWHLSRVQDDHLASAAGAQQVWASGGWVDEFALPFDSSDIGYGMDPQEVGLVQETSAGLLTGYHDAVCDWTTDFVRGLTDSDLERVVDAAWDPPVTLGVRLVSVIGDCLQHCGQAAYVRGLVERRG